MKSYPFTSKKVTYDEQGLPIYDRAVDSAFLRKVFSNYFSDGVFYKPTNALQVVADTGMQVVVEPGVCHIRGAMGIEESRRTMVVQAAEEMDRIDTVVARLDLSVDVRSVDLYVIKGTAAESPQPPALTRDSTKWEIGLANLFVAKNVSTITQQRITDTRLDNDRCGVVAQTIGDLDTAPYFAQLAAAIAQHQTDAEAQIKALQAAIEAVEGDNAWMMQALYDKEGFRRDIFSDIPYSYKATFTTESWMGEGPYTQTAQLTAVDGGPAVAADSILLASIGTDSTLGAEEKEAAQSAAALIAKGSKTLGTNTVTVSLDEKPESDVTVYFRIRKGAGHSVPTLDPVGTGSGMKLLWENKTPTAQFSAQTISIPDLMKFSLVKILVKFSTSTSSSAFFVTEVFPEVGRQFSSVYAAWDGEKVVTHSRAFVVASEGISVSNADRIGAQNNGIVIPYKIYGIKI